jgi:hypothetical protein
VLDAYTDILGLDGGHIVEAVASYRSSVDTCRGEQRERLRGGWPRQASRALPSFPMCRQTRMGGSVHPAQGAVQEVSAVRSEIVEQ